MRVLLADDEPEVRFVVGRHLSRCGWQVDKVIDGEEALDASRNVAYDAAVLGLLMPGRSGLDVATELSRDLPVVLFSAFLDPTARHAADDAGCRVVDKTDLDGLVAALEELTGA